MTGASRSASVVRTVFLYQLRDLIRGKWIIAYALFFALAAEGLLRFGGGATKALVSMSTIVLFVVPLVTLVYATVYLYSSREFVELLLAQPVRRSLLYVGLYAGVTLALASGVVIGSALPFLVHGVPRDNTLRLPLAALLAVAAALTCVFTAVAFLVALRCEDRMRGLGAAIGVWFAFGLVYDGVVLIGVATFSNYALERPLLAAMLLNPLDLARVILLMQFDSAALMGYTGAVFQRFFGGVGAAVAALALAAWISVPALLGARAFRRKDF